MFGNVTKIIDGLWLGNYQISQNKNFIKQNNISVIINCTKDLPFLTGVKEIKYMYRIPIDDNLQNSEIYEMSKFLTIILPIINSHLNH